MSTLKTTNIAHPSSASNNVVLASDGSATIATLNSTTIIGTTVRGGITSGTSVASTSGTSIDFTGLPSWVKRITVMLNGVSISSTANLLVQVGTSAGVVSTGYIGTAGLIQSTSPNASLSTAGFPISSGLGSYVHYGIITLVTPGSNVWLAQILNSVDAATDFSVFGSGGVTLSSTLDRVRITTTSTDTFDAGTINILYEG